jgi:SAM-dependent methyltransferase
MPIHKFLYNYLLPPLFRMGQEHISWFIWVPILGDTIKIKKRAIDHLELKRGDRVLVYSIGSGLEAKLILDKVGKEGCIVGVDLAEGMLGIAQEMVDKNNWTNVKLVLADVREYDPLKNADHTFDAALSNFGYLDDRVLHNLINAVRPNGHISISGPQPLRGLRKIFYPITFVPEMIFGLTWKSLHKFPTYIDIFREQLTNVRIDENTFAKYFAAVYGTKK